MSYQNVSAVLSAADLALVLSALDTINSKLPFLISLTEDERRSLIKMGSKSVDFVQDASEAAKQFPNVLPATFNQPEFGKDNDLIKQIITIKLKLDSTQEKLDDTLLALGSEAMVSALEVYSLIQSQADRVPGLKSVAEKLQERWKKNRRKTVTPVVPD